MDLDPNDRSEAVFTPRDGGRTYAIERVSLFGCFIILSGMALGTSLMPLNWFQANILFDVVDSVGVIWPKLHHDAELLQVAIPMRGTKYALFVICCGIVVTIFLTVMLPLMWCAVVKSSMRLSYHQSAALWKLPVCLVFLVYWIFFEALLFDGDTSLGRVIIGSGILWFWTALVWGAFAMTLAAAVIVMAKLWTHGVPENSYEYNQRKFHRPKRS